MTDMEKKQRGELIVGLDVGTTKICAVIGEVFEDKLISSASAPTLP
jgi:cell division protein FtsA